ncbi:hypothetical protein ADUPG1_010674 [Aduncisulcus paluster]|uniref:Uncharacterized protein n=1 Tax=Aduncisulcus paluster TaxID=2918883 RepID=A0ABQ5JSD6_9EUKA|nr:hypothetical protein ADUPG1_010674 [Aduncisulcus paluster]
MLLLIPSMIYGCEMALLSAPTERVPLTRASHASHASRASRGSHGSRASRGSHVLTRPRSRPRSRSRSHSPTLDSPKDDDEANKGFDLLYIPCYDPITYLSSPKDLHIVNGLSKETSFIKGKFNLVLTSRDNKICLGSPKQISIYDRFGKMKWKKKGSINRMIFHPTMNILAYRVSDSDKIFVLNLDKCKIVFKTKGRLHSFTPCGRFLTVRLHRKIYPEFIDVSTWKSFKEFHQCEVDSFPEMLTSNIGIYEWFRRDSICFFTLDPQLYFLTRFPASSTIVSCGDHKFIIWNDEKGIVKARFVSLCVKRQIGGSSARKELVLDVL